MVIFGVVLTGPSFNLDSACSSGLEALCNAVEAIKGGRCDMALVGAVNILLKPVLSKTLNNFKMLAKDGKCKAFDASGRV